MAPKSTTTIPRSPVVAVVGHIDHGKSTLLDYIRKTNTVAQEKGGITQHLSAYEAVHENASGAHTITFLDTPGHAAFSAMRERGLSAADVAILVVSAEEGVKPQTLEALELIKGANIPYIVALTKADKETANIERAKASLLERGVYLEGLGGEIPYVAVSGKTGAGISELLDLILLAAELQGITTDPDAPAAGTVIEAHIESKRGASATLIVKNGVLRSGEFVIAGAAYAPVRIMENFLGKDVREAGAGSPVRIVGFSALPAVGGAFSVVKSKKEAESIA
ncbi:MAG: GTP-binding protein, partial [Patescibacteria group bacterium]|nr:GTP-binding protein [Patescibacteria group bacterium]